MNDLENRHYRKRGNLLFNVPKWGRRGRVNNQTLQMSGKSHSHRLQVKELVLWTNRSKTTWMLVMPHMLSERHVQTKRTVSKLQRTPHAMRPSNDSMRLRSEWVILFFRPTKSQFQSHPKRHESPLSSSPMCRPKPRKKPKLAVIIRETRVLSSVQVLGLWVCTSS